MFRIKFREAHNQKAVRIFAQSFQFESAWELFWSQSVSCVSLYCILTEYRIFLFANIPYLSILVRFAFSVLSQSLVREATARVRAGRSVVDEYRASLGQRHVWVVNQIARAITVDIIANVLVIMDTPITHKRGSYFYYVLRTFWKTPCSTT